MLLLESIKSQQFFITPFVHIYEVFAGISAAMVGITEIRTLTSTKFGENFALKSNLINNNLLPLLANVKSYNDLDSSIKNPILPDYLAQKIDIGKDVKKLFVDMKRTEEWAQKMLNRYNIKNEEEKVVKIVYSLCVIVFLFTMSLMFIIAAVDNQLFEPKEAARFLAHTEIFVFPAIVLVAIFINREKLNSYSCFLMSLFIFVLVELLSLVMSFSTNGYLPTNEKLLLFFSLFICSFPIIALCIRTYIVWKFFRFPVFKREFTKHKTSVEEASKIINQILAYMQKPTKKPTKKP